MIIHLGYDCNTLFVSVFDKYIDRQGNQNQTETTREQEVSNWILKENFGGVRHMNEGGVNK